jgi:LmbE family N-acetylglucosaminyl deacetylase
MKKILILAPHADDEVLGCGGTIHKYSKLGYQVHVSVLTNASVGAQELFSKNLITKIRSEASDANKILNVKNLMFYDLPAPCLDQYPSYKIANLIQKIINKIKPDTIFIPSEKDMHIDHKIINQTAMVALRPVNKHNVKRVFAYETLSETHWGIRFNKTFSPNYFEKLTNQNIRLKQKSFLKYKSQVKKFPHPRSTKGIEVLSNFRGMQIGSDYAEAFEVKMYLS